MEQISVIWLEDRGNAVWCKRQEDVHSWKMYEKSAIAATKSGKIQLEHVNDHTTLKAPLLVRSAKLSSVGSGQYLDGWPPGNTRCRWHFVKCVMHFFTICSSSSSSCFKRSIQITRQSIGNTVKGTVVAEREKNTSTHPIFIRVRKVNAVLLPQQLTPFFLILNGFCCGLVEKSLYPTLVSDDTCISNDDNQ